MLRQLYTWLFRLALPLIMIRLLWRSWRAPAYRRRWRERFALFAAPEKTGGLWLHAVSLGESIAAIPLIKGFQAQHPHLPITITNMTPTGSEKIKATFGDAVQNFYVPYDLPGVIKRFLKKVKPALLVIMETELWPNLLHVTHKQGVPIMLANGRISESSAKRYAKIASLTKAMLQSFTVMAVQTDVEAERYRQLGAKPDSVVVTGSIKFDINVANDLVDKAAGLRRQLGEDRLVWIAASTHEGEEEQIIDVFATLKQQMPELLLILVPRHPERFSKVVALCKRSGYEVILRSENKSCDVNTSIFVGDTMGEMMLFYAVADLAFVGGSLMPIGGHNLLEPAALAKAAVTGPHMHNFVKITELLLQANALKQIRSKAELLEAVQFYLADKSAREEAGLQGQKVVAQNRGALAKHLQFIDEVFS